MTDLSGQAIRGYELQERIGEGGFGAIYKAYQTAIGRDVAVKVILPEHASKPEFIRRFENEARLIGQLEHPHIVPLYDYWRDEVGAFLVMRWLRSGSLRASLDNGVWNLPQTAHLLDQLCDALSVAHQSGVIHRDLKPANILLDERGNAYLTDFGIAKDYHKPLDITDTDAIIGSPAYLSPEQIQGVPVLIQSDIYSLGIMIYELLVGAVPFHATTPVMLALQHLEKPIPNILETLPDVPEGVNAVLLRATAKDPNERYPDAPTLARDFRMAANLTPVEIIAAPVPPVTLTETFTAPRHKTPASQAERNRLAMLQNVRQFWIEGVLEKSLHGTIMIELGMQSSDTSVERPWDALIKLPDSPDANLPPSTGVLDLFDKTNGKLLILGEPGSGKTNTLLNLARDLLARAEADVNHPIPVVFNLSSWTQNRHPIRDWLAEELNGKYQVPMRVADEWIETDSLTLLLDGLDEVDAAYRDACVQAINDYRSEQGFVDMVVCSRTNDYEMLSHRLKLNLAVVLEPLTNAQIDTYLTRLGGDVSSLRRLLDQDEAMRELSRSPLALSIMVMAYHGKSADTLVVDETVEARRNHLFAAYIQRMFERSSRADIKSYPDQETVDTLSWVANRMIEAGQTVFHIEDLHPRWLKSSQDKSLFVIGISLITGVGAGFLFALAVGLVSLLRPDFSLEASSVIRAELLFSLMFALFGLVSSLLAVRYGIRTTEMLTWSWRQALLGGLVGMVGGVAVVAIGASGFVFGLTMTLGLAGIIAGGFSSRAVGMKTRPNQGISQSGLNALRVGSTAFIVVILGFGLAHQISSGPTDFIDGMLGAVMTFGVAIGLASGLLFGGMAFLQHYMLRLILWRKNAPPRRLADFLDYAVDRIFLRHVGGGYIFVHRLLLEYFASIGQ